MGSGFWHWLYPMYYVHALGSNSNESRKFVWNQNYQLVTVVHANCFFFPVLTHCFPFLLQFSTCPTKSLGWFQRVLCWLFLVSSLVALYGQQTTLPLLPLHLMYFSFICCPPLFWMLDILCQIGCSLEILVPSFCMLSLGQSGMLPQLVYPSTVSIRQE